MGVLEFVLIVAVLDRRSWPPGHDVLTISSARNWTITIQPNQ